MNLAQKFQNSWELMKTSLRVIRDNPRLALFPIVSFFGTPVLVLFFMAPILVMMAAKFQGGAAWMDAQVWLAARDAALQQPFRWVFYSYGAVIYLVSLFAAAFFNVALYHEILRALAGERVSLKNGLRFASGRLGSILMWSLLAGT
ncbi:MAG: hypothetical protein H7343_04025, partial [Undibacterium sp.]|nr:hypothetical protein [Opitutaceae bacterium]